MLLAANNRKLGLNKQRVISRRSRRSEWYIQGRAKHTWCIRGEMLFSLGLYRFSWFVSSQLRVTAPVADPKPIASQRTTGQGKNASHICPTHQEMNT